VGGADKLASVKDMVESAELHLDASVGGMTMKRTARWVAPSFFREDTKLPFGDVVTYGDGQTGWMSSPQGQVQLSAAELKPIEQKLLRLYFLLLLSDRAPGRTIAAAGDHALDISDSHGNAVRLFVDEQTGLPARLQYTADAAPGAKATIDETYVSFAAVDGIQVPNHLVITQNGHKYADVVVESTQLNTGLKTEDLSKKP